ncbi:MAG: ABC transporter permease, partial [Bacteroidia bacterium]|nr:ABC transporter permease [Bacteroidia bacterium]
MIKNYLKLAIRNLLKNKIFTLINVIGLSLGIAVCISILLFVQFEKSFDTQHSKNIYRLDEVQSPEGMAASQKVALSMYPMASTLKSDFPEVKNYVRLHPYEMAGLAYNNKKVFFDNVFWSDPSFFQIFDYKLLRGNPTTVLTEPNSVVLTHESAAKLFGNEDPIGKLVTTHNRRDILLFKVTGVMENIAKNSHLQFNGLYSLNTLITPNDTNNWRGTWGGNWLITYLELADNTNIKQLEAKFPAYLKKYMGDDIIKSYQLFLQPLKEVHSTSGEITHDYHNFQKFDKSYTNIFLTIGIIVLLIAGINFVNLSTAKSGNRAKEVGVRKSIGAQRSQLTFQFLIESTLVSFTAMLIALALVKLFLPLLNTLSGHELEFSVFKQPLLFLFIITGTFLIGLLSGVYPALYLSSLNAVKVLKGISLQGSGKSFSRNTLVVGQFACAAFLIITTIFVIQQLNFMRSKDAGFNKDEVVIISGAYRSYAKLKTALEQCPLVKGVTGSSQSLGNNLHQTGFMFKGNGPQRELASSHVFVDKDFVSLYQIKFLAGKDFTKEGSGREYIINETMAKELLKDEPKSKYESLIGKTYWCGEDSTGIIVGITTDFNFNTLHTKIETLTLVNQS